jgi:hypothetical protein
MTHRRQNGGVMYGWRARIGNISPTACSEILPYEFYQVAPEGVAFVSTNLVIRRRVGVQPVRGFVV